MKKILLPAMLFMAAGTMRLPAQHHLHYHRIPDAGAASAALPGFSGTGGNIDVLYHRVAWIINPNVSTKNITGTVTTKFKTLQNNVSTLSFDLNRASFNNTSLVVRYRGISCAKSFPASGNVNILNITLPATIAAAGTVDSIVIAYSGTPPSRNGYAEGLQRGSYFDISNVRQFYISTLSQSYEDRDWWPCKASMQDKIDSMDIQVTVPWSGRDTFWVATNGKMTDSAISGTSRIFKFSTRYPIASYLVSLAVAKYNRYYRVIPATATSPAVPVVYNLLRGKSASYYTNAVAAMDKLNLVLAAFSSRFGPYPFSKEKHGFYDGLLGAAGMEHQTFSAIASSALTSLPTLAHELMHQWFGNHVTYATWNDLWLGEGFARYGEALAGELVPQLGIDAASFRRSIKNAALSLTSSSAWIPNSFITSSNQIWGSQYGSSVYERGAMLVSMLRTLAGDDIFYKATSQYLAAIGGGSATADSLKFYFNKLLGQDISGFFNSYAGGSGPGATAVGGTGNPIYNIRWNRGTGNSLLLGVASQQRSAGSNVTYFQGPVTVRVTGALAGQDTTITFYDWGGGNLSYAGNGLSAPVAGNKLRYNLSFTPVSVLYDDQSRTLSTGTASIDLLLLDEQMITRTAVPEPEMRTDAGLKPGRAGWMLLNPAPEPLHKELSLYR